MVTDPKPPRLPPPPTVGLGGTCVSSWNLTGRARLRRGWFNRAVLTVEEERRIREPADVGQLLMYWRTERRWRDARFRDLPMLDVQLNPPDVRPR